jgi:hypothetical protein
MRSSVLVGAMILALIITPGASAQSNGTIDAGTTVTVRTNEAITASDSNAQVFTGTVDKDVMNRNGTVAIPKGSDVELVVKDTENNQLALDLGAIIVNGQRYSVQADNSVVDSERKEGIGANKRTGKYVGGGAVLGAIVGAIAGGGKGAAVGAGAGAAAGAGVQVLTRGQRVNVPAESLLTFRLQQPLQTGLETTRQSRRFKPTFNNGSNDSAAYRAGVVAGRSDADRNLPMNMRSSRWTSAQDRSDYEAGYERGYRGYQDSAAGSNSTDNDASVLVDADNNITWQAPTSARVYVQVDNRPLQLFAEGTSGTQAASWIEPGHVYIFILRDLSGNELARDRLDLRRSRGAFRRNR